jgi:ribosomal protein S18 acetylase RimI-like enzyme
MLPTMTLTFRRATEDESDLLADMVFGVPEQETSRVAARLFGVEVIESLRDLFRLTWREANNWRTSELAMLDGVPVGVLQTGGSSLRITPRVVLAVLRVLGVRRTLRLPVRLRIRGHVTPPKPEGAYLISEIHTVPEFRDRGIGAALLVHAEEDARRSGAAMMALTTLTTNPARRFYERSGFEVAAEATNPEFERLTGAAGNVLYVKRLG